MIVHILKVAVELIVVILAMWLMSWGLAWILRRMRLNARIAAIAANLLCFVSFVVWLHIDMKPYGGLEVSMIAFGLVVWGVCLAFDLWRIKRKAQPSSASA